MKYSLSLLLVIVLGLMSCEGPQGPRGPEGPPGRDGEDGWANFFVAYYTINTWYLSDDETFFYADVDYPELTDFVYNDGVVVGYYMINFDTNAEVQIPLPYDIYYNDSEASFTETISYDFVPGSVRFYYETSDFYTDYTPPACTFKVALMW